MNADDYVRVCPVCDRENPPELARCACGAALAGVDFSLKRAPTPDPVPDASTQATPEPALDPSTQPTPVIVSICAYDDCAQPNPPGSERCVYCNRLLHADRTRPAAASERPLPSVLRNDYRVLDAFPATGSEADLLLVEHIATGERRVAKLYRKGLAPDERLVELLAQADGDYVVRVLAHGVSDGVAYEIQEYLPHGTLRQVLAAGPLSTSDVRRIAQELADALNGIHARRILHRDLKPENVLVRTVKPLQLALSDFGIASLREATQHFTGGARTAKYAAPEALTGVIDDKSDWWALGMIALEAATGGHPFDGLSEQVINHHLATRPVDVRSVYDDSVRTLCRGLLLRDPTARWGSAEVTRWLAGDSSLTAPEDSEGYAIAARPYRIGTIECTNGAQLAVALVRNWEAGVKDLARGQIGRWIEQELHDYNLVRKLADIVDRHGLSDDMRLLQFVLAAAPDLPPVWRGEPVSRETLLAAARRARQADLASLRWLDSIAHEQVLARLPGAGHHELGDMDREWRQAWSHFLELWKSAQASQLAWRKQAKALGAVESARIPDVDDLMHAAPPWQVPPRQDRMNGLLLLALFEAGFSDALRNEVMIAQAELAGSCPWFDALMDMINRDPVAAVVAHEMLPQARDDAESERHRQGATQAARERVVAETRATLHSHLDELKRLVAADSRLGPETVARLFAALEQLQETCRQALSLGYADQDYLALRRGAEKLSEHALAAQQALARCEQVRGLDAILLRPERLAFTGMVALGIFVSRVAWLILALILVSVFIGGYFWYRHAMATHAAKAALRWLHLHAKTIDPNP